LHYFIALLHYITATAGLIVSLLCCSVGSLVYCHPSASLRHTVARFTSRCGQTTETLWVDSMQAPRLSRYPLALVFVAVIFQ